MKSKVLIIIIAISVLLQVLLSPLRGYVNINVASIMGYIVYLFYTSICFHYFSKKISVGAIAFYIIVGICLLQLPFRIIYFGSTMFTLPDMFCNIFGVLSMYFYSVFKGAKRWLFPSILFFSVLFMATVGYELWENRLDNGTFLGRVSEAKPMTYQGKDLSGNTIKGPEQNVKITLLDFWFIGCKPCYVGFPELQRIYDKYKNNNTIKIYALNLPQADDQPNEAFDLLKQQGYNFPNLILESNKISFEFGVKACPTTILLDKNSRIIFRGSLLDAEKYLEEIL